MGEHAPRTLGWAGSVAWRGCIGSLAVLALCCFAACEQKPGSTGSGSTGGAGSSAPKTSTIHVVATIPPLGGILRPLLVDSRIDYDLVTLVPPGASEHGFELTPDNMKALAAADVVVMVGLDMEPQVEKFLKDHPRPAADRRIVVLADVLHIKPEDKDDDHDHADHDHDHHDDADDHHHHHGADPHVWLDPSMMMSVLEPCAEALHPSLTESEWARVLIARQSEALRISILHGHYTSALEHAPRRTIVVGHDAYGYLARRYNLEVVAISGLNAGEPRPDDLKKAADTVREKKLTTIFVEPQLSPAAAERLAQATGAKIAVLDPLGDGDWFKLMDQNLVALKNALLGGGVVDPAPPAKAPDKDH